MTLFGDEITLPHGVGVHLAIWTDVPAGEVGIQLERGIDGGELFIISQASLLLYFTD